MTVTTTGYDKGMDQTVLTAALLVEALFVMELLVPAGADQEWVGRIRAHLQAQLDDAVTVALRDGHEEERVGQILRLAIDRMVAYVRQNGIMPEIVL